MRGFEQVHNEHGTGKFVSGERYSIWVPKKWRGDSSKPIVSIQHGSTNDGWTFLNPTVQYIPLLIAGKYGLPVIAADQDGAPAYKHFGEANDASQLNAWNTITGAQSYLGTKTGPDSVVLFGTSMGSMLTFCLHRGHQSEVTHSVHALAGIAPDKAYDANDPLYNFKADADQAYSDVLGGWKAAARTHDPEYFYVDFTDARFVLMNTTDDPTNGGKTGIDAFVAAVQGTPNAIEVHYYGLGGHDITKIDYDDIAKYVVKYSGVN